MLNLCSFFITICKSFWPTTCFGWTFCIFFNGFELSIEMLRFWYPYRIFAQNLLIILALFANFTAKRGRNGWKKPIFKMCLRIPFYIHFWSEGLHFVKKVKIVIPSYPIVYVDINFNFFHPVEKYAGPPPSLPPSAEDFTVLGQSRQSGIGVSKHGPVRPLPGSW